MTLARSTPVSPGFEIRSFEYPECDHAIVQRVAAAPSRQTKSWLVANPEAAMAKLLEIANGIDADHAGRISVGAINHAFLRAGGNVNEYGAAMHRAVADGWLESHPSGAYVKLTQKGADRFA